MGPNRDRCPSETPARINPTAHTLASAVSRCSRSESMIDVVQALELFEICADEMATEDADGTGNLGRAGGRRMTLTARALAKRQLHVAHLARFPLRRALGDGYPDEPTMTLGAMIVFRTADRFGRAGASTTRTIEALYRAVQRYVELIPDSLQDGVDK